MSTFLLVLSTICFIATFGIHIRGTNSTDGWCPYMNIPWMAAIPWISGFVLAVIPESMLFDISWWWLFLINIPIVCILGPLLTTFILRRIASGKGTGVDVIVTLTIAITALTIVFFIN